MSVKHSVFIFILLLAVILSLASCERDVKPNEGDLVLLYNGETEYSVICSAHASSDVVSAGIGISKRFYDISGVNPPVLTDLSSKEANNGKEIVVGNTNRAADIEGVVAPQNPNDFLIAVSDQSIYLLGGSDEATIKACKYFADNILSENTFIDPDYRYFYEHKRIGITVGGVKAEKFHIYSNEVESELLGAIGNAISDMTGKPVLTEADADAVKVCVKHDSSLPNNTIRLTATNGVWEIVSSSTSGFTQIPTVLRREFDRYTALDFPNRYKLDFGYPIVSYDKLAENAVPFFSCKTDKDPLSYELGEEMVFDISLCLESGELVSAPYFYYTISTDYNGQIRSGMLDASQGKIQLKAAINQPGFVKLYVAVASESGTEVKGITAFNGGAGAGVSQITQSAAEPDDFDEFWQGELAKLFEIEPNMTIVNDISEDYPGYKVYDVRVDSLGEPVSGYISIPENAEEKSLNILVGYTGYGVVSPMPNVRSDSIVFAVNAHSIENGREDAYYSALARNELYSYGFSYNENINRDTVYFKNMILRDVQAVRCLMAMPEWNGNSISLNGGSQGAFQAIAVAALVPEVSYLYIANTWMCDIGSEGTGRLPGWRPDYTDALRYYDSVNFAKRVKCYTRIEGGLGDYVTPPSGIMALFNNMKAACTLSFIQGLTHYYTPPVTDTFSISNY